MVVFRSLALRLLNSELPDHVIKVFAFVQIFFITGRNPSEVVLAQVKCDQLKKTRVRLSRGIIFEKGLN